MSSRKPNLGDLYGDAVLVILAPLIVLYLIQMFQ